jgi:hypothetical protein
MGRLSTVYLLVKIACFVKMKKTFIIKSSWLELVRTRGSTVLRLPLLVGFHDLLDSKYPCKSKLKWQAVIADCFKGYWQIGEHDIYRERT